MFMDVDIRRGVGPNFMRRTSYSVRYKLLWIAVAATVPYPTATLI